MADDISISIRNLQHYLYCPHRWGLINIDCDWAENYYVTKSNLMHKNVHDPDHTYISSRKRVLTSVPVYNDKLNLYGVTDCIELRKDSKGVSIEGYPGKYNLTIVEYKPSEPEDIDYNLDDLMQVFAQKVCVDSIFMCDCQGVLYYGNTKKRKELPLREHYDQYYAILLSLMEQIRADTTSGTIPSIREGQKCSGCSFSEMCIPQLSKNRKVTFHRLLVEHEQAGDSEI